LIIQRGKKKNIWEKEEKKKKEKFSFRSIVDSLLNNNSFCYMSPFILHIKKVLKKKEKGGGRHCQITALRTSLASAANNLRMPGGKREKL